MNWGLFWPLLALSITIKWIAESPESRTERALIAVIYLIVSGFAAWIVPPESTLIGVGVFLAPIAGDIVLKVYRHREISKIYASQAE